MKKAVMFVVVLLGIALLSACGSTGDAVETGAQDLVRTTEGRTDQDARPDFADDNLPVETQLLFGTFLLEDTDLAVTPEQAPALLPLWKVYRSLINSDTAANAEISAVVGQIEDTMTPDQLNEIARLGLSENSMFELLQKLGSSDDLLDGGVLPGGLEGFNFGEGSPEGFLGEVPGGGAPPEGFEGFNPGEGFRGRLSDGGIPGGGQGLFGPGADGNLTPEQQATLQARMTERSGARNRMNTALLDALIDMLEGRAQAP